MGTRHEGRQVPHRQDHRAERDVADRVHLLQDDRVGLVYLSTILDDFSRYVIAWRLCTTMKTEDVTDTLELALTPSGCSLVHVRHKPRLLSDNDLSYISGDLAELLGKKEMKHFCGAPYHLQTQGKFERWHQTKRLTR
jgi:putative transposase